MGSKQAAQCEQSRLWVQSGMQDYLASIVIPKHLCHRNTVLEDYFIREVKPYIMYHIAAGGNPVLE